MTKILIISLTFLFTSLAYAAPILKLSLPELEKSALANSQELQQLQKKQESTEALVKASKSSLYPSLSLDAKGSWVSDIPTLTLGNLKMEIGDNWGYSVGPTVKYVVLDGGAKQDTIKANKALANAQTHQVEFAKNQLLLQIRQRYFLVQNNLQQLFLLNAQLRVASKQLQDITSFVKAGAKSNLDKLLAQKQQDIIKSQIIAMRANLSQNLHDLFKLAYLPLNQDISSPSDARLEGSESDFSTTCLVTTESLDSTLVTFASYKDLTFDENLPQIAQLEDMAHYYNYLANLYKSFLYPSFALQGGAYWEYPNSMIKEHVFLGRASALLSVPLFEGGSSKNKSKAQMKNEQASQLQKQDITHTLTTLFDSAHDQLSSFEQQEAVLFTVIKEAQQIRDLTYQAYQSGSITFFEVDKANLALLEAQIALSNLQVQQLNNLAILASLGKGEIVNE